MPAPATASPLSLSTCRRGIGEVPKARELKLADAGVLLPGSFGARDGSEWDARKVRLEPVRGPVRDKMCPEQQMPNHGGRSSPGEDRAGHDRPGGLSGSPPL